MTERPVLTLIQSTHASLDGFKQTGLFERHARLVREYAKSFDVVVYSSDSTDYSVELGVTHKPVPWLPRRFFWRHLLYYIWLVGQASRMQGVIKVIGSNIPTLPLIKLLSHRPMLVTYQFDYARVTQMSEKGIVKKILAPLLERLALEPADIVTVTTLSLENKIGTQYHKQTVLVPNWVDVQAVSSNTMALERDPHLILYAGRLHSLKGVGILIKAFSQVRGQYPDARLIICGSGEERESLEAQVRALPLQEQPASTLGAAHNTTLESDALTFRAQDALGKAAVEFRGAIPNAAVMELLQRASIFVLPTLTMEGHPKALVEAMACGTACIATNVPGNHDVIVHEVNGLLVPPGDAGALARAIGRLLDLPELRTRLANTAQRETLKLSFARVVPAEVKLLQRLLNDTG